LLLADCSGSWVRRQPAVSAACGLQNQRLLCSVRARGGSSFQVFKDCVRRRENERWDQDIRLIAV
jgi:hypothetical protein